MAKHIGANTRETSIKLYLWNIDYGTSNLKIFISIIQSSSFANGGVLRQKIYV